MLVVDMIAPFTCAAPFCLERYEGIVQRLTTSQDNFIPIAVMVGIFFLGSPPVLPEPLWKGGLEKYSKAN